MAFNQLPAELVRIICDDASLQLLARQVCKKWYVFFSAEKVRQKLLDEKYQQFKAACQKIELDLNYNPSMSNEELLNLAISDRVILNRDALVIQPSSIKTDLGKLYQIKIATYGTYYMDDSDYSKVWNIDDSAMILVRHNGNYSIHNRQAIENNNFNPLRAVEINKFLNQQDYCPHPNNNKRLKMI